MDKELADFRRKWKDELHDESANKNDETERVLQDEANAEGLDENFLKTDNVHDDKSNKSKQPLSDVEIIRSKPNTLEPFLLAERLLEESNNATCSGMGAAGDGFRKKRKPSCNEVSLSGNNKKRHKEKNTTTTETISNSYLDAFLADLNEINEIPFFEISLPRELAMKIFRHLGPEDLCRCAQVSKAWQSLAEDEVLWCEICHQMKYEVGTVPLDHHEWKTIVRGHVMRNNQLPSNWKSRTGRSGQLQYVQGGVLRAAHSLGDKIVLGYTSGDVKFWRVHQDGEECVFKPSGTALALLPDDEQGTAGNVVTRLALTDTHVVAGYSQGYVDVWSQEGSTSPVHSFRGPSSVQNLAVSMDTSTIAANFGSHLAVVSHSDGEFTKVDSLDIQASEVKLIARSGERSPRDHLLVLGMRDMVCVHVPTDDPDAMTSLSHVYGHNVLTLDARHDQVAFGFSNYLYNMTYGVHIYDVTSCRQVASLHGYTAAPSCVNLQDSPPHALVTGCRSSVVRVYDVRVAGGFPVMTFQGHQRGIQTVQQDDWKVVSGGGDGLVCVWDQRMAAKLWELHGRHPVKYTRFHEDLLVTANIPDNYSVTTDPFDNIPALRYRGSAHVYDFSTDQASKGLPDICSSAYDEPAAYNYNVRLAVPYDSI